VGSQLVSETGLDGLTLSFHHTEPVLGRFGGSTLLERIGIQTVLVPGHIPDLALVAVPVTGVGLEHPGIAVLELSLARHVARSLLLYLQTGACLIARA